MKKGRPKKIKKERENKAVHAYLNDEDYRAFVKKSKENKYTSQSSFLRDLILNAINGANA